MKKRSHTKLSLERIYVTRKYLENVKDVLRGNMNYEDVELQTRSTYLYTNDLLRDEKTDKERVRNIRYEVQSLENKYIKCAFTGVLDLIAKYDT